MQGWIQLQIVKPFEKSTLKGLASELLWAEERLYQRQWQQQQRLVVVVVVPSKMPSWRS